MATFEQIDSPNAFVRAIERWKRGLAVAVIVGIGLLIGIVVAGLAMAAAELAGNPTLTAMVGAVAFLIVAPYSMGQRLLMRQIGKLAEASDT